MNDFVETVLSMFLMVFGLGFFLFVIWFVANESNRQRERDLQRDREFGLREPRPGFITFNRTRK